MALLTHHTKLFKVLLKSICLCLANEVTVVVWEWTCTGSYAWRTGWRNRTLWATVTCITRASTSVHKRTLK